MTCLSRRVMLFQSTRPRGARLHDFPPAEWQNCVSIHAPARGATAGARQTKIICCVSIHAPARGATDQEYLELTEDEFQSTRPRGARRIRNIFSAFYWIVSIHAPARGATQISRKTGENADVSIHAPARGATAFKRGLNACFLFQSTRPRGARRSSQSFTPGNTGFNPRAREGRDP